MKLFQLNFFSAILLLIVVGLLVVVPSFIIENIWNSAFASNIEQDLSISIWQAALLWGAALTLIYMSGLFSFKVDFKTLDSIDIDSINDPELREEIMKLKLKSKNTEDDQQGPKQQDSDDTSV